MISIHALREEGDQALRVVHPEQPISIHALREEGDGNAWAMPCYAIHFNPRPPRGGRLAFFVATERLFVISIHALREEGDGSKSTLGWTERNFNPRPPRGGRPVCFCLSRLLRSISIHALREEGDVTNLMIFSKRLRFQSTPSARRATAKAAKKSTTFVPLYTLVHNLKRNFTKAPAK